VIGSRNFEALYGLWTDPLQHLTKGLINAHSDEMHGAPYPGVPLGCLLGLGKYHRRDMSEGCTHIMPYYYDLVIPSAAG
jgi:hypothetical protein